VRFGIGIDIVVYEDMVDSELSNTDASSFVETEAPMPPFPTTIRSLVPNNLRTPRNTLFTVPVSLNVVLKPSSDLIV